MSSPFARSLPSRADLAQQKKQAKELLQSFQSGDDEARARVRAVLPDKKKIALADAQLVLAREYGFSTGQRSRTTSNPALSRQLRLKSGCTTRSAGTI